MGPPGIHDVLARAGFMLGLLSIAVMVVYFEGGLVDERDCAHPDFASSVYYAIITITAVGYGDIVPVRQVRLCREIQR